MNAQAIIHRLETFPGGLAAVVGGLTAEELRFKPASGNWSVLEVLCHLADEEVEDFRPRLMSTLEDPTRPWPPTDPEGWARERRYDEQDPHAALERFTRERAESVRRLRALTAAPVDWTMSYQHPKVGPVMAGELLASWVGHDALHLRQIAKRMWELAGRDGAPHKLAYAGEWKA